MHLGIWEGEVNESLPGSLPGACPPGNIHAVIYKRLTFAIYTRLDGCLLCTLWKGLGVVGDENLRLVAMADATTVLSIPTLQSLHSRGHISDSQLMSEYVSAGYPYATTVQLLARYHNLRMSVRTFKNRLLYVPLGYSADWTPPPQTRYGTASRSSSTCGFTPCCIVNHKDPHTPFKPTAHTKELSTSSSHKCQSIAYFRVQELYSHKVGQARVIKISSSLLFSGVN